MRLPKYQLKSGEELLSYEFVSEGPRGLITKRVQFTLINRDEIYNLAFGDKDIVTGELDDLSVSNNGDREKVLATVLAAVYAFLDRHPNAWIFAAGSTSGRTRLYRIGISKYLDDMENDFEIYGLLDEEWQIFERERTYSVFLARRK